MLITIHISYNMNSIFQINTVFLWKLLTPFFYSHKFLDDIILRFKIYALNHHNKPWNQHSSNHFLKRGNYFLEILPKHQGQNCWNMSWHSFPRPEAGHLCIYDGESAVCKSLKTHSMMKVKSRWSLNPTCLQFHSK